jgi:hypothetical protein
MRNNHRNTSEGSRERSGLLPKRLTRFVMGVLILVSTVMIAPLIGSSAVGAADTAAPAALISTPPLVALPRAGSAPMRLTISGIDVKAPIARVGLLNDGSLEVPPDGATVGWFTGGPRPGEVGPAVIAGHVNWAGSWAVFEELATLKIGDIIHVKRRDGNALPFLVIGTGSFNKNTFPTNLVYGNIDYPGLRLITCSPYGTSNIIVFGRLVSPSYTD